MEEEVEIEKIQLSPKKNRKGRSDDENKDSPIDPRLAKNRSEMMKKGKRNEKGRSQNIKHNRKINSSMKVTYSGKNGDNLYSNTEEYEEEEP